MRHVYVSDQQTLYSFAPDSVVRSAGITERQARAAPAVVVVPSRPIFYAGLSLTNFCNLTCRHCPVDTTRSRSEEVTFTKAELAGLITQLCAQGLARVSLTGGEPLLYRNIEWCIALLASHGVEVKLNTNGTHVTVGLIRRLADAGLSEIDISINGIGDDRNAYRDGSNLSETRLRGLRTIADTCKGRVTLTASSVLTSEMTRQLGPTAAALSHAGADQWRLRELMPCNECERIDAAVFPDTADLVHRLHAFADEQPPLPVFGYLYDCVRLRTHAPRCKNLEEFYVFVQFDRRVYWMHGLIDALLGTFDGRNVADLATALLAAHEDLPIPHRCRTCPARFICTESPLADLAVRRGTLS